MNKHINLGTVILGIILVCSLCALIYVYCIDKGKDKVYCTDGDFSAEDVEKIFESVEEAESNGVTEGFNLGDTDMKVTSIYSSEDFVSSDAVTASGVETEK